MSDCVKLGSIEELVTVVDRQPIGSNGRVIVGVAGAPASGKSTTASKLVNTLNAQQPGSAAVLPMDGYHFDDMVLNARGHRDRKGAPHTFDVAGFAHTLARLRANTEAEVAVPVFDRSLEIARAGARIIRRTVSYVVAEGNYLLLAEEPWSELADLFDITVFVETDETELRRRLRQRWAHLPTDEADKKVNQNDLPNARLIQETSRAADYVLSVDADLPMA